ncbi:hypothetical protein [Lysobacter sp. FW306-1B-D06B]|uniref:hypothetical protein n=1 Tax=Lysobacter sp. FW306-1B-D06B TaxID=3140250 RepID=UPI0031407A72
MINGFRVKSLKAIADSGALPLVRINVLVGKNSAGKSSLLRFFPLLRQSVEQRTKGPILWYGRFVDFGSFQNVINAKEPSRTIEFQFQMTLTGRTDRGWYDDRYVPRSDSQANIHGALENVRVSLVLGQGASDEVGQVKEVGIDLGSDSIKIRFLTSSWVESVSINGVEVKLPPEKRWHSRQGKLLPIVSVLIGQSVEEGKETRQVYFMEDEPFLQDLIAALLNIPHGNTSTERMTRDLLRESSATTKAYCPPTTAPTNSLARRVEAPASSGNPPSKHRRVSYARISGMCPAQ